MKQREVAGLPGCAINDEVFLPEEVARAYERMMSNEARFRLGLATEN